MEAPTFVIQFDPTPRPIRCYAELWHRDEKTLNAWCRKGWVPGAFRHPNGEWWVKPLELLGFEVTTVESKLEFVDRNKGTRSRARGRQEEDPDGDRWTRRSRHPSLDRAES